MTVHTQPDLPATIDSRKLLDLLEEVRGIEQAMDDLAQQSFDATLYRPPPSLWRRLMRRSG